MHPLSIIAERQTAEVPKVESQVKCLPEIFLLILKSARHK